MPQARAFYRCPSRFSCHLTLTKSCISNDSLLRVANCSPLLECAESSRDPGLKGTVYHVRIQAIRATIVVLDTPPPIRSGDYAFVCQLRFLFIGVVILDHVARWNVHQYGSSCLLFLGSVFMTSALKDNTPRSRGMLRGLTR
ncbi:hypothetical protein M569_17601 [Genlisea aurea]|uniref:Uncharacterized protein n=1 Tax=Genlisea aurea TaxID=192259 RepID=S8BS17_9LAMI|nr:hypothetical protein M569_17601 [Genlisea aurea]